MESSLLLIHQRTMATPPLRRSARLQAKKLDWSTALPCEFWESIGEMLPSGRDAANFRSMCRTWCAALPFTKFAPAVMLPFDPEAPDGAVTFYRPTEGKTFTKDLPALHGKVVCGSSHGWLALVDKAACLTLLNPFTGATVALPPTDGRFALDFSIRARMVDGRWLHKSFNDLAEVELCEMRGMFFCEVVLSSPADSGHCTVMALISDSRDVAFCRVGVDATWKLLKTNLPHPVTSIVHCRNRFLAITLAGQVSICNVAGATPTARLVQGLQLPTEVSWARAYLQVKNELHLVGIVRGSTHRFWVYKCNVFARTPVWSRVDDCGDLTLLTSSNFMAGHFGGSVSGLRMNSIFFSVHSREHITRCDKRLARGCEHNRHDRGLEIIDIASGASQWLPYCELTYADYPEALCWIVPNPWTQGKHTKA